MTPPRLPRPLLVVAGLAVVAGLGMVFVGGFRTGVSWDETYHVLRMRNFLGPGWYLLDGDLQGDHPGPWEDQAYVYAPVAMILLHAWTLLWGVDGSGLVSGSAEAFALRHVGVGLISAVGIAAAAALTRLVLGSWRWGLVAAAFLVALPLWTGQSMFNVKDVPVATGYTLTTLGLALVVGSRAPRRLVLGGGVTLSGLVLAVGTRPGIWPGLALAFAGAGVLALARSGRVPRLGVIVASGVAGFLVLLAVYPAAFSTPVTLLLDSALESSRFGGHVGFWWYVPLWLLVEVPSLLLVLGTTGALVAAVRIVRRRTEVTTAYAALALVLLQGFALPVLASVRQSNLYNGLRQLLFAAPPLAVLAAVGTAALLAAVPERGRGLRMAAGGAVGLALVAPLASQLAMFPYNYGTTTALANVVAANVSSIPEIPTDYWRTSVRELAPKIPADGWVTCTPLTDDEGRYLRFSNDSHDDCATDPIGPLAPYDDLRSGSWDGGPTRFLAVQTGTSTIADNCTEIARVTRWLIWRPVTMSYVATCDLALEPYPAAGLSFDGAGEGSSYLLGGWSYRHGDPGIALTGSSASLGVQLPTDWHGSLALDARVLDGDGLRLTVNGETLATRRDGDHLTATVPARTVAAYGERRLVVGLADPAGDARLLSLDLTPRPTDGRASS